MRWTPVLQEHWRLTVQRPQHDGAGRPPRVEDPSRRRVRRKALAVLTTRQFGNVQGSVSGRPPGPQVDLDGRASTKSHADPQMSDHNAGPSRPEPQSADQPEFSWRNKLPMRLGG